MPPSLDVVAVGNAIVDLCALVDDQFLQQNGLVKGAMQWLKEEDSHALATRVKPVFQCAGGSAANSIVGISSLGGSCAFIGLVKDDAYGHLFCQSLQERNIKFSPSPQTTGPATGICQVFITPEGERTMATYLGASICLSPASIDPDLIQGARITFLECYLFEPHNAKETTFLAARLAKAAGRQVALSLSDSFCVLSHREEIISFAKEYVDILIGNAEEARTLSQIQDVEAALSYLSNLARIVVITNGPKGAYLVEDQKIYHIAPPRVEKVVDTTGAGDLFAAGILYGISKGLELPLCGQIAALTAGEAISHIGSKPQVKLSHLLPQSTLCPTRINVCP